MAQLGRVGARALDRWALLVHGAKMIGLEQLAPGTVPPRSAARTFVTYRSSVETLAHTHTETQESLAGRTVSPAGRDLLDRGSEEAASSASLLNAMNGHGATEEDPTVDELRDPSMQEERAAFGQDLVDLWTAGLLALSPSNLYVARHFCTSAREVLLAMVDGAAPDAQVAETDPDCARTDKGVPTRRAKIGFLLRRKGIDQSTIDDLVEADMNNVLGLFREFNGGTHGRAGRFTTTQLSVLRIRVESAIGFIHTLCAV